MDREDGEGDGGDALVRADGVDDRGVDGPGGREEEELADDDGGEVEGTALERQGEEDEGRGDQRADAREPEVGVLRALQEPVAEDAADVGAEEPGQHGDHAERDGGLGLRRAARVLEEGGHPCAEAAGGEGGRGVAEDGEAVGTVREERDVGAKAARLRMARGNRVRDARAALVDAAGGVHQREREHGEGEAGEARDVESGAPSEVGVGVSAEDEAEGGADRDGGEEDREHAAAGAAGVVVGEEARGDGAVGGLADADEGAGEEEAPEADGEAAEGGRDAPDEDADGDEAGAGEAVAEGAEDPRRQHVDDDEGGEEAADLDVLESEAAVGGVLLEGLGQSGEDVPVEVVEEVDQRQDDEAAAREADELGRIDGVGHFVRGIVSQARSIASAAIPATVNQKA